MIVCPAAPAEQYTTELRIRGRRRAPESPAGNRAGEWHQLRIEESAQTPSTSGKRASHPHPRLKRGRPRHVVVGRQRGEVWPDPDPGAGRRGSDGGRDSIPMRTPSPVIADAVIIDLVGDVEAEYSRVPARDSAHSLAKSASNGEPQDRRKVHRSALSSIHSGHQIPAAHFNTMSVGTTISPHQQRPQYFHHARDHRGIHSQRCRRKSFISANTRTTSKTSRRCGSSRRALARVELLPHVHCASARPVVDASS